MSALLLVLLLYNLPRFIANPGSLPPALLLLVFGLVIDAIAHFIIYRRPVCAVSAAVTALIVYTLSPGTSFWGECAALAAALILGKALWGGTGKNPLNPAMLGLVLLALLSPGVSPAFEPSLYLVPAVMLSLPFLLIRPYAGIGMIMGMAAVLLLHHDYNLSALINSGVFFWACLVITDPVTMTSKPASGLVIGFLTGFIPGIAGVSISLNPAVVMPLAILVSNLLSRLADSFIADGNEHLKKTFGRRQKITLSAESPAYVDLTNKVTAESTEADLACEEILRRIEKNSVFGFGGAAYPSSDKIRTVMASAAPQKHFIINAAECDPGLVHDKWLLLHHMGSIIKGIEIIQKCVSFKSVTVAAKDFNGICLPSSVVTYRVSDFYPAGSEKLLVKDALKPASLDNIPAVSGILVLNIQTVCAICEAVLSDWKADTRFLTIANLDNGTGKVVRVKLGAGVTETAEQILGHVNNLYIGGGIMNACLAEDDAVIGEKTNFLAIGKVTPFREAICSQCDFCSAYCPALLHVRDIAHCIDEGTPEKAALLHPETCMECALCSAVCLAGRDQAKRLHTAKRFALEKNTKCI